MAIKSTTFREAHGGHVLQVELERVVVGDEFPELLDVGRLRVGGDVDDVELLGAEGARDLAGGHIERGHPAGVRRRVVLTPQVRTQEIGSHALHARVQVA